MVQLMGSSQPNGTKLVTVKLPLKGTEVNEGEVKFQLRLKPERQQRQYYFYSHFTDEETEAQWHAIDFLNLCSWMVTVLCFNFQELASETIILGKKIITGKILSTKCLGITPVSSTKMSP